MLYYTIAKNLLDIFCWKWSSVLHHVLRISQMDKADDVLCRVTYVGKQIGGT